MTHSVDFRRHFLSIKKKEGLTFEQTAKRFAVGIASLTRWNKTIIPKATRENRPRKVDLKELAKEWKPILMRISMNGLCVLGSPKVDLVWASQAQYHI